MKIFKSEVRFPLAVLVGGVMFVSLQLVSLGKWSTWHDEGFTAMLIQYDWGEMVWRASFDVHPPLYYLILKAWVGVFGYSPIALRSLSVLCMTGVFGLSIWLIRRVAGKTAAWWALPALALAPALVRYGQEMRMYGLACLLGLSATHLLISLLKQDQKLWTARWWRLVVGYVLCVVALLYTHYFASLVIITHWVLFVISKRRALGGLSLRSFGSRLLRREYWWVVTYVIIALGFSPWFSALKQQADATVHSFWVGPVGVHSFFSTLSTFWFFHPEWLNWKLNSWYSLLVLLAAGLLGYFIFLVVKSAKLSTQAKVLLVGYWSLPMLALFLVSLPPLTPYYFDRYFVVFTPLFYGLLGVGSWLAVEDWRARSVWRWIIPVAVLAGLLLGTWNTQVYGNNFGHNTDDSYAMQELSGRIRPLWAKGDVVVAVSLEQYFDAHYYLNDLTQVKYFTTNAPGKFGNNSVLFQRDDLVIYSYHNLHPDSGRVWIITNRETDPSPQVPPTWKQSPDPLYIGYARLTLFTLPQTFPQ